MTELCGDFFSGATAALDCRLDQEEKKKKNKKNKKAVSLWDSKENPEESRVQKIMP